MKILYLSSVFTSYVHYPAVKLEEKYNLKHFTYFFVNQLGYLVSKKYRDLWSLESLSVAIDPSKYKFIKLYRLPRRFGKKIYPYIMYFLIYKKVKKAGFDIIHAHSIDPCGILAYNLAKKLNIPYIITEHGPEWYNDTIPTESQKQKIVSKYKEIVNNSYALIAVSEGFCDFLKSYWQKANIITIHNSFDSFIFKPNLDNSNKTTQNLITVGSFCNRKNHILILEAVNNLKYNFPNIHLTIIGSGAKAADYEDYIHKHKLENYISIKDFMPHHQLVTEYQKADIFILSSLKETFGIVILEAMACGVNVICSKTDGVTTIINDGIDGLIFENNDLNDLCEKIKILLENPSQKDKLREKGLRVANLYANKHDEIYQVYKKAHSRANLRLTKRIIIDGTSINKKMDGLTQYILNILANIEISDFGNLEFILLLNKNCCPPDYLKMFIDKGIQIIYVKIPLIGPIRDIKFWLYHLKNIQKSDMLYSPSNQYPLCWRGGFYTIHDLIFEKYPEQLGKLSKMKRLYIRMVVRHGLKKADKVIAVSECTKNEILAFYSKNFVLPSEARNLRDVSSLNMTHVIPSEARNLNYNDLSNKIVVIYEGYEHLNHIEINTQIEKPFLNYFLFIGSSRGHKNLTGLLKAIFLIKDVLPHEWGLVLIGNPIWMTKKQLDLIDQINFNNKKIHITGHLPNSEMAGYFQSASAFIFPSLAEGFGIPILEAFFYQIPLLCSNHSVFHEVAGEAALYFDPHQSVDIGEKMLYFIDNKNILTADLISKGTERLKIFGWVKAAQQIEKYIYEKI